MFTWIRQLLAASVFEDEDKTRVASLLHVTLLAVSVSASILTLVIGLLGTASPPSLVTGGLTAILALALWFIMRSGYVQLASALIPSILLVGTTVAVYFAGTVRAPIANVYILCFIIAGLLISSRAAIVFTLLSLLAILGLIQAETAGLLPPVRAPFVGITQWVVYASVYSITAVLLILATRSINEALERARRNERALTESNRELEAEITERKRAEEELGAEKEFSESMLNAVVDTVFVFDPNTGKPLRWNKAFSEISGYTDDEIASKKAPDDWYGEKDLKRAEAITEKIFHKGQGTVEMSLITKDGRLIPTEYTGSLIEDAEGKPQYLIAVGRDITERKRMEETLRRLEMAVKQSIDGIAIANLDGYIQFVNPAWAQMHGYRVDDLLHRPLGIFHTEEQMQRDVTPFNEQVEKTGAHQGEVGHVRKDGTTFPTWMTTTLLRDEAGNPLGLVGIARDITERKQAERTLQQRTAQLEALRQVGLEITTQLDLDTLLHSIVSWATELLGGTAGGLYLYRPEEDVLEWAVAIGPNLAPTGTVLHRGEGLSGRAWETDKPLIVDDYQQWEGRVASYEGYPLKAVVGVPVRWGEEFLGVLNVLADRPRTFSPADAELLGLFANQAAIAIGNARLYGKAQQELEERKRAEEALRESEKTARALLNAPTESAVLIDTGGIILATNETAAHRLGKSVDELVGLCLYDLFSPAVAQSRKARIDEAIRSGEPVRFEDERGGTLFDSSLYPVFDAQGKVARVAIFGRDITERKRTEEVLRESERKFRSIVEQSSDGIMLVNEEGAIIEWNQSMERITGLDRTKVLGHNHWDIQFQLELEERRTPTRYGQLKSGSLGLLKTGQAPWLNQLRERDLQRANGTPCTLQQMVFPIKTHKGFMFGAIIRDISERKQAEEALQQHARDLELLNRTSQAFGSTLELNQVLTTVLEEVRQLLGVAASSVWLMNPETDELVCQQATGPNSELVRGWCLAPGEGLAGWVARHGQSLILPDAPADERHFKDVDQQTGLDLRSILVVPLRVKQDVIGVLEVLDTEVARFNPTHLTLLELLAASAASAVENARLYEQARQEIAERKRAEEALRVSEEKYRDLVENINDIIYALDGNGVMTYVSPVIESFIGYSPSEVIGRSFTEFIYREDRRRIRENFRRIFSDHVEANHVEANEYRVLTKSGEIRWMRTSSRPVFVGDRVIGVQGMLADITARKQAEEQLQVSLQEKEVLLKEVHHRVKNNLQVVSSLLNLQADYTEDEQVVEMFRESRNRVKSMALVHERLYRSQDLARVDFAEYIQDLAAHLFRSYRVYGREIALEIEVADVALGIDMAVPCGLVVNELISNTLKHAFPPEGDRPDGRGGEIRVGLSSDQGKFNLAVGDNGVGFPQDLDFRDTESLGLQLVVTLVEQLDGSIELDRSDGTTFKIEFPERKYAERS